MCGQQAGCSHRKVYRQKVECIQGVGCSYKQDVVRMPIVQGAECVLEAEWSQRASVVMEQVWSGANGIRSRWCQGQVGSRSGLQSVSEEAKFRASESQQAGIGENETPTLQFNSRSESVYPVGSLPQLYIERHQVPIWTRHCAKCSSTCWLQNCLEQRQVL